MDWFKKKFANNDASPEYTTLYVKKNEDGTYMVSKLALTGYAKYDYGKDEQCWVSKKELKNET